MSYVSKPSPCALCPKLCLPMYDWQGNPVLWLCDEHARVYTLDYIADRTIADDLPAWIAKQKIPSVS